jgi:hypothetical protein
MKALDKNTRKYPAVCSHGRPLFYQEEPVKRRSSTRLMFCKPGCIGGIIQKNDGLRGAVLLAGAALDAKVNIDMGLCFSLADGRVLATNHAGTT